MKLLLDTHIYLWSVTGDKKLTKRTLEKLESASQVYISSASIWEAAIKIKLGKLEADLELLIKGIEKSGFLELPVTSAHVAKLITLEDLHRDPFDRILIAQAISEPLTFLTADAQLKPYSTLVEVIA